MRRQSCPCSRCSQSRNCFQPPACATRSLLHLRKDDGCYVPRPAQSRQTSELDPPPRSPLPRYAARQGATQRTASEVTKKIASARVYVLGCGCETVMSTAKACGQTIVDIVCPTYLRFIRMFAAQGKY